MTYRIIIEPTAERGIRESMRWISAQSSRHHATKWLDGLIRAIEVLETHPARWPLAAESDNFPVDVRELLHGRGKRGIYRVLDTITVDAVHILYVRQSTQDELGP